MTLTPDIAEVTCNLYFNQNANPCDDVNSVDPKKLAP